MVAHTLSFYALHRHEKLDDLPSWGALRRSAMKDVEGYRGLNGNPIPSGWMLRWLTLLHCAGNPRRLTGRPVLSINAADMTNRSDTLVFSLG